MRVSYFYFWNKKSAHVLKEIYNTISCDNGFNKRGYKARVNLAVIFGRPRSSTLNLMYWLTPHHTLIDPHIIKWTLHEPISWNNFSISSQSGYEFLLNSLIFFSSFILFVSVYCSSDLWDCSIALERSKSFCYFKLYFSTVLISLGFGFSVDPLLKKTSPSIEWTRFS